MSWIQAKEEVRLKDASHTFSSSDWVDGGNNRAGAVLMGWRIEMLSGDGRRELRLESW